MNLYVILEQRVITKFQVLPYTAIWGWAQTTCPMRHFHLVLAGSSEFFIKTLRDLRCSDHESAPGAEEGWK